MLTVNQNPESHVSRSMRRERQLWHDPTRTVSCLGCGAGPERSICGGLRIKTSIFDCLAFCCGKPDTCDNVCRLHPDYAGRVREIGTFGLDTIGRTAGIPVPILPQIIPMLFHGSCRSQRIAPGAVA